MVKNILVIFGGNSSEHDISIITGVQALNAMPTKGFNVIPAYIREGVWHTGGALFNIKNFINFNPKNYATAFLHGRDFYVEKGKKFKKTARIDAALLCTHGGEGENGALQGFLEVSGVPHSSASVRESAACMDKFITKLLLKNLGVATVEGCEIAYPASAEELDKIENKLGYPIMVKPTCQGSSIGAKFAKNRLELEEGIELSGCYGNQILLEKGLTGFTELNCAAAYINNEVLISQIEKPVSTSEFLTYNEKYMSGNKGKGMAASLRECPAKIAKETEDEIVAATKKVYSALNLFGVVRIDYMLKNSKLYLNEINTIPGSLAFYLFKNLNQTQFLKGLVEAAITRGTPKAPIYKTDVLSNAKLNGVKK
jgi:D-alanine-D-alanine ligase